MRIICTGPEDEKTALELAAIAKSAGLQADVVGCRDAYALTIWSIDDIACLNDARSSIMNDAEKELFLVYAEKQLKADMTERGWDSLNTLIDMYFDKQEVQ